MSLGTLTILFIIWSIIAFGALYFIGKKLLQDYKLFKSGLLSDVHFIGNTLSQLKTELITMVGSNTEEIESLKRDFKKIIKDMENNTHKRICMEIEPNKSYVVTIDNSKNENTEEEIADIISYFKSNNSQVLVLIEGEIEESK